MDKTRHYQRYRAVIVSPHLDDAVFSCGGAIAQMVKEGPVLVLNLFTRYLSDVKIHGAVLGDQRYQEEIDAARFLGFESCNLGELDAPFRRDAYLKLGNLFRSPVAQDMDWLPIMREKLFAFVSELNYQELYVPLGIGWHVDHVLTYLLFEPWAGRKSVLFYEDAPYCCIPHSTRYRLDELATYPRPSSDRSLAQQGHTRAWWQAARSYANTALMKNLKPWLVRQFAVPVVTIYIWNLMKVHREQANVAPNRSLLPVILPIKGQLASKVEAMALYRSQFREFFAGPEDCVAALQDYANLTGSQAGPIERFWVAPR